MNRLSNRHAELALADICGTKNAPRVSDGEALRIIRGE